MGYRTRVARAAGGDVGQGNPYPRGSSLRLLRPVPQPGHSWFMPRLCGLPLNLWLAIATLTGASFLEGLRPSMASFAALVVTTAMVAVVLVLELIG